MSNGEKTIEKLNYDLELEKFRWQKLIDQRHNTLLNRHFGVIITAIISVAAIAVSYLQLDTSKANLRNEELKNDRQFYLEVARFLLQHQQDVTSNDPQKVTFLRNIVVSTFPKEIALRICMQMSEAGITPDMRRAWAECVAYLQSPPRRSQGEMSKQIINIP